MHVPRKPLIPPGFSEPRTCSPDALTDELMTMWNAAFNLGVEFGVRESEKGHNLQYALLEAKKVVAEQLLRTEKKNNGD